MSLTEPSTLRKPVKRNSLRELRRGFYFRFTLSILPLLILVVGIFILSRFVSTTALASFDDVFLAVGAGMITLTGAYIGAELENRRELEREVRLERRRRAEPYREYLNRVIALGQRVDMVQTFVTRDAKEYKDKIAAVSVTRDEENEMLRNVPPMRSLSAIENPSCRVFVDEAIELALRYWIQTGQDRPDAKDVQEAYQIALQELDYYEHLST